MIYETAENNLERMRKQNVCAECGRRLYIYLDMEMHRRYLSCPNLNHQGIAREYQPAKELNIKAQREELEKTMTTEKAQGITKYTGLQIMTEAAARDIVSTIWPEAPAPMQKRAMMICRDYNINPLLPNQIHMLKFKQMVYDNNKKMKIWNGNYDWELVIGIGLTRIKAARRMRYSYMDFSPRAMTDDEQMKINGKIDKTRIWRVCILKNQYGDTFYGVGSWPVGKAVKGEDNGNTPEHMGDIHAEKNAVDKMCPELLPPDLRVIDEKFEEAPKVTVSEVKTAPVTIEGMTVSVDGEIIQAEEPVPASEEETAAWDAMHREEEKPEPVQLKRDPTTIKSLQDLYVAVTTDWPKQFHSWNDILKELSLTTTSQITDLPMAYLQIANVRN
jgi:hypothetical protein